MVNKLLRTFKPIFDRVLVQKINPKTITKSGILLPESINKGSKSFFMAKVLSTGTGKINQFTGEYYKSFVKPGDTVVVPEHGGISIQQLFGEIDHEISSDLVVYREEDILGIFENGSQK
ncbi:chaperonin 10 Kd subunit [Cryptosporidium sp. chipmunk genotype I]|uniref:chaperonin 10 Kd subunit n=1 Tax=Cryptosporidium sp. chipmunk genotype I TaxID=1280935 RepID=UPI00351A94B1|nr:chaperonin 10 Kd subunit [Cryptosporidium sp. chipmunk genotype I]